MRTVGFFNNKGGVGKTSLVYHISWMLAELGYTVIAADFDPQANLTSFFLDELRLETIEASTDRPTVYGAVSPLFRGIGDIKPPSIESVGDRVGLLAGDLELSRLEDALSQSWSNCAAGDERSFRTTGALGRTLATAIADFRADLALVDVGPNLGAINRAALIACDHLVVPLGADVFSLQGLRNMGPTLRDWRGLWSAYRKRAHTFDFPLPSGELNPIGYVAIRHSTHAGRASKAYQRWMDLIPAEYQDSILDKGKAGAAADPLQDENCLASLKDYRSLMPMAQEARKPMFSLKPADGAFGGHQTAVQNCYADFRELSIRIAGRIGLPQMPRT